MTLYSNPAEVLGATYKQTENSEGALHFDKKFWVNVAVILAISVVVSVVSMYIEMRFMHKLFKK